VNTVDTAALGTATLVLAAAAGLVDAIHSRVAAAGFDDLRPVHGFAFSRLAAGATAGELAEHLGVTKQAASQLVDELEDKGYVVRGPHPRDARARLLTLTERGWACTRAADAAATEAMRGWCAALGPAGFDQLRDALAVVAPAGPLRPASW
jgi:DNA-binding MarR family transcriptional regulator